MPRWKNSVLTKLRSTSPSKISLFQTTSRFNSTSTKNAGRVHILGVGNLGRLYAHALASSSNPPPITLLLSSQRQLKEWEAAGRKIIITTNDRIATSSNYDVEIASHSPKKEELIENLILCTKTLHAVEAVSTIKHRLSLTSTILFTQNGMGTTEEVLNSLGEDFGIQPSSLTAIASHGVYSTAPFTSVHAGLGTIMIGRTTDDGRSNSDYLVNLITTCPTLNATSISAHEIHLSQLEKLVVNSAINPVTAIFNCLNGDLSGSLWTKSLAKPSTEKTTSRDLHKPNPNAPLQLLTHILASEASSAILAAHGPSMTLQEASRFSEPNLKTLIHQTAEKTAANQSSMLQDVRAGRETEIEYINGAIVRMGREYGVDVTAHERVVEMVKEGGFREVSYRLVFGIVGRKAVGETTRTMRTSPVRWERETWVALVLDVGAYCVLLPYLPF